MKPLSPDSIGPIKNRPFPPQPHSPKRGRPTLIYGIAGVFLSFIWYLVYSSLHRLAETVSFTLLGLTPGSGVGEAVSFFLYDTPKVFMLLFLVIFAMGIIRTFFTADRTRKIIAGKGLLSGHFLAALLGVVTPFCSCSAVPLFIGFVSGGIPLGITFSFLVAAPMVNEVALGLLYGLLGWKIAAIYLVSGLAVAMGAGLVIGRLKMEGYVQEWVGLVHDSPSLTAPILTWPERINAGKSAVRDILGKVWPYIFLGIGLGAVIHGYVPAEQLATFMGKEAWWSVPLAVLAGIPMYSNAAGVIPVVEALLGKGAALGTVLAFMMAVVALSLPEVIILRRVLKTPLILAFLSVVGLGILLVGILFNILI